MSKRVLDFKNSSVQPKWWTELMLFYTASQDTTKLKGTTQQVGEMTIQHVENGLKADGYDAKLDIVWNLTSDDPLKDFTIEITGAPHVLHKIEEDFTRTVLEKELLRANKRTEDLEEQLRKAGR